MDTELLKRTFAHLEELKGNLSKIGTGAQLCCALLVFIHRCALMHLTKPAPLEEEDQAK